MGMRPTFRVAVKASDPISHAGITRYLASRPEVQVLAPPRWADADVVILVPDRLTMPNLAAIGRDAPRCPAILIANKVTESDLLDAVKCRIMAVLPRAAATDDRLLDAIKSVASRDESAPPDLLGELVARAEHLQHEVLAARGLHFTDMNAREVDVLRLMADGFDTAEIAQKLCYSQRTVKNIIHGVNSRLHLRNRQHAVAYAMRTGVI
jgi:DNA-binding NarL/FixJ family response regulator